MSELKGPAYFEVKNFINNRDLVEFYTINNKFFRGYILWFDNNSFQIELQQDKKIITLLGSSIIYYSKV